MTDRIRTHEFDNGLVLVAEEMPGLESAAFTFLVPGGSVYDPSDRRGLASISCDLITRGAGERDSRALTRDLENLGVERAESVAAGFATYRGATIADSLPAALEIYADILRRPMLPKADMDASRMVVLQEIRSTDDSPSHKCREELSRRFFPDPWGLPNHGDEAGVAATAYKDVQAFVSQHYQPRGSVLGVAGKFDWDALLADIERLFADWKPNDFATPPTGALGTGATHVEHESNQTQIAIAYPSVAYRDPDYFQAAGAVGVLSSGSSARLFTEVREKRGLCYSVFASQISLREVGGVMCMAGTSADRAQETLDVILAELERLPGSIEDDELARLKARTKSGLVMAEEASSARSASLARDWHYMGRTRTLDEVGRLVDELTCDSIHAFLEEHRPGDYAIVTLGPQPLEVPDGVS
ncbi:MAG: insulinase family protein [Pirellulales bacterium]|nr:insulinase family protein [Pirellulales bacterium]